MTLNLSHKEYAYLLGCYTVVADKEINELEVSVLDQYMQLSNDEELYKRRHEIFSDSEEAIQEKDLVYGLKLSNFTNEEKAEIVGLIVRVAFGDNFISAHENEIIRKVSEALNFDSTEIFNAESTLSETRINDSRLSSLQRFVGNVENVLYDTFADKSKIKTIDMLLGSLGYSTAIEKITDTAAIDLERVSKILSGINDLLVAEYNRMTNDKVIKNNTSKEVQEVAKIVEATKNHFQELINVSLSENLEVLEKKRRNIRYFTIAFMGRTKAGKSTLHKVITQQDNDDIGVGKLRTTRYNRSWYWEKLRIVDTPGIGAPGGDVDTEIAKSIIDEADIICYVVTSDSIQETEFDFFETIKERNKPLYIILNVKSNLSQNIRLKRFIENPYAWKECDGPQSISGHLDRIHDKLDGKYNMNAVEIIPTHLLAAQLGLSKEYDDQTSQKLIDGSNIMEFIRSVKKEVHSSGSLKKSLSIIDGTAYQINTICKSIKSDSDELNEGLKTLRKKRNKFKTFIETESTRLQSDIKIIFKGAKDELINRASSFANEHYDDKNAGTKWQNDTVVKSIHNKLDNKLKTRMQDFNEKVKSEIEEIAADIKFMFQATKNSSNINGESITNFRLGVGIIGSLLSAAAPFVISNIWNPAGWIIALGTIAVGIVVSLITSLFTSKAEKIRKATERLKNNLNENITKSIAENQEKALNSTVKSVSAMYNTIDAILSTYITNTESLIKNLEILVSDCELNENAINSLIGFRVLEYVGEKVITNRNIDEKTNKQLAELYPVKRDWQNQSLVYMYKTALSAKEIKEAERATQMIIRTEYE